MRRSAIYILMACMLMAGCAAESEPARDASAEVAALAEDAWQHLLQQSPYLQNRQGMLVTEIPDLSEAQAAVDVAFARRRPIKLVGHPREYRPG